MSSGMPGYAVSFDDILEKEWQTERYSEKNTPTSQKTKEKKPFLKRGARGWWKESEKAKSTMYTLTSEGGESQNTKKNTQFNPKLSMKSKESKTKSFHSTASNDNRNETKNPISTWNQNEFLESPRWNYIPPIQNISLEEDDPPDLPVFDLSFSKSTDTDNLSTSYDWNIQQDANELEEFEMVEKTLLQQEQQPDQSERDFLAELDAWSPEEIQKPQNSSFDDDEGEIGFSTMQYFQDPSKSSEIGIHDISFADSEPWDNSARSISSLESLSNRIENKIEEKSPEIKLQASPPPPPPPPASLQSLKMKLQQKTNQFKSTIPKSKIQLKQPISNINKKKIKSESPPKPTTSSIPALLDSKLQELEQEVKHYKQETFKLQKKREAIEMDQKKFEQIKQTWLEEKKKIQEEIDIEWKKIRKEKRTLDQTLKFGNGLLPDRKERQEIEALKAQIVRMKMEDQTKTNKQKSATDFFRHRIAELELRNQELRDELKFLEQERLANWNWTSDEKSTSIHGIKSNIIHENGENSTRFSLSDGKEMDSEVVLMDIMDENEIKSQEINEKKLNDLDRMNSNHQDESPTKIKSTATLNDVIEIKHPSGKIERKYTSGLKSKTFLFANGTEKDIYIDGHSVVRFSNGDIKETYPIENKTIYYYASAQTRHITYGDNTQIFEFPNGQIEKHYSNNTKEITFIDGTSKKIEENGDEYSTFPDGTRMIEKKTGFREVINPDGSKARDYPDGRTTWVTPNGIEQPVQLKRPGP